MISSKSMVVLLALLAVPIPAAAQLPIPVVFEARVGYAVPSGDFSSGIAGAGVDGGPMLAAGARLHPTEIVGLYVGYQQIRFGCPGCESLDLDGTIVADGIEGGVHLVLAGRGLPATPWLRGGLLRQTLAFSSDEGETISSAGLGFSGGLGVTIPITGRIDLQAGTRYFSAPADFRFTVLPSRSVDVAAIAADLGLTFRF